MIENYTGELAALGTAMSFAVTSIMFTFSGRIVGSPIINRSRLLIALSVLLVVHQLSFGQLLPLEADLSRWFWLGLSGVIGLSLGDASLFQALILIGPRLSMLMMALAPVFSTILAWLFLGETLVLRELVAIGLVVGGIGWVVTDRRNGISKPDDSPSIKHERRWLTPYTIGLLFGLGGALGQAMGLITSKIGLADDFPALSANLIRILTATIMIWGFTAARRQVLPGLKKLKANPRAFSLLTVGAIAGPVVGVSLSLVAVQRTPVGIASTLMSLTPIFLIPVSYIVFGERTTRRAIIGTLIAFVGTALLFVQI